MSFYQGATAGDTQFRKKFTVQTQALDEPVQVKEIKDFASARENQLDLTRQVNKTQVVDTAQKPGYYCETCDLSFKEYIYIGSCEFIDLFRSYQWQVNFFIILGRGHQKNLGITMRVEKTTAEQVRARLDYLREKRNAPTMDLNTKIQKQKELEMQEKQEKKEKRLEKKRKAQASLEEKTEQELEMNQFMGFSGFASSKK